MQEIPASQYAFARPLFARLVQHHLAAASFIAGKSAGTVLVDDRNQPRTVYGLYATAGWEQALGTRPLANPGKTISCRTRHFYRGHTLLHD
jgi:hypothetical protein